MNGDGVGRAALVRHRRCDGVITFDQVGPSLPNAVVTIPYQKAEIQGKMITGTIPILDIQYGNVWTNISNDLLKQLNVKYGNMILVMIFKNNKKVYEGVMPFYNTFLNISSICFSCSALNSS